MPFRLLDRQGNSTIHGGRRTPPRRANLSQPSRRAFPAGRRRNQLMPELRRKGLMVTHTARSIVAINSSASQRYFLGEAAWPLASRAQQAAMPQRSGQHQNRAANHESK